LVKEMVPTTFKSKSALSTSNDVFSTNDLCDLAPLFTKMSIYYDEKKIMISFFKFFSGSTKLSYMFYKAQFEVSAMISESLRKTTSTVVNK